MIFVNSTPGPDGMPKGSKRGIVLALATMQAKTWEGRSVSRRSLNAATLTSASFFLTYRAPTQMQIERTAVRGPGRSGTGREVTGSAALSVCADAL